MCAEVADSQKVFGHYVGHDEPSMLFYSNKAGSGNHLRYVLRLPKDPSASNPNQPGKSYAFELSGAEWLGMAICDSQSYPEQVSTCPPDSNKNILDPTVSPKHVGQAYMELQFYPPGWIQWPAWQVAVGATTSGTYTPSPKDLFMNSGDRVAVSLTDTSNGLKATLNDLTTGHSGSMTASKSNGFAQVKFDPTGSSCQAIPYNFHPMYSTSNTRTRVTWAAGSYNIAFDTEIGHFQFCQGPYAIPATQFGIDSKGNPTVCPGDDTEGYGVNAEPTDSDDIFCFPGSEAPVYKVSGCTYTNVPGYDGASYQPLWPNGNTKMHPTAFQFTSPETGPKYNVQYGHAVFEADLPGIEPTCNTATGAGCTLIPQTDESDPATFYPFYSITKSSHGCVWHAVCPGLTRCAWHVRAREG